MRLPAASATPVPLTLLLLLLLLLLAQSGCARDAGPGSAAIDMEAVPLLAAVEELRLGDAHDPEAGFWEIAAVDVAADGRVFVLDRRLQQVRVFGAAGERRATIGRPGSGPGEFVQPLAMGLVADTLWVRDPGSRRLTLFDLEGALLATVRISDVELAPPVAGMRVTVSGAALLPGGRMEGAPQVQQALAVLPDDYALEVPRLIFDLEGAVVDTAGYFEWRPSGPAVTVQGQRIPMPFSFPEHPLRAFEGGDALQIERPAAAPGATRATLRVARSPAGAGRPAFSRDYAYAPVPLRPALRDSIVGLQAAAMAGLGVAGVRDEAEWRQAIATQTAFPAHHPPVIAARVGSDGALWLLREDFHPTWRWLLLEPDGTPRGRLELPRVPIRVNVQWSGGDHFWAVERDALGVQWLVRYRIEGG